MCKERHTAASDNERGVSAPKKRLRDVSESCVLPPGKVSLASNYDKLVQRVETVAQALWHMRRLGSLAVVLVVLFVPCPLALVGMDCLYITDLGRMPALIPENWLHEVGPSPQVHAHMSATLTGP